MNTQNNQATPQTDKTKDGRSTSDAYIARQEQQQAVAKRLKEWRTTKKWSQMDVCSEIDYRATSGPESISKMENGEQGISSLVFLELHNKFGIDLNYLIAGDTTCPPTREVLTSAEKQLFFELLEKIKTCL